MQPANKPIFRVLITAAALILPVTVAAPAGAIGPATYSTPSGHLNITVNDLKYLLDQIKIGQAHALRTSTPLATLRPIGTTSASIIYPFDVTSADRCLLAVDIQAASSAALGSTGLTNVYPYLNTEVWGLRQVDGQCNNITNVVAQEAPTAVVDATSPAAPDTSAWGAADQQFPRLSPSALSNSDAYTLSPAQSAYQDPTDYVKDATPRIISNMVSDQSDDNLAAIAASDVANETLYGDSATYENSINATTSEVRRVAKIPNVTTDFNSSAGFNSWMTNFGQFYNHGVNLIPKSGKSVYIPLQQDDPLYVPSAANFMVLTRGAEADGESENYTTSYIDQSQSYGSHASQNFFLREYAFATTSGTPTPTGRLLEGIDVDYTTLPQAWLANRNVGGTLKNAIGGDDQGNGGLATWKEIKAQALLLGIGLSDHDVNAIPVIATDQYGAFIPGPGGMPMMLYTNGDDYAWVAGTASSPISTGSVGGGTTLTGLGSNWIAVSSGHAFLIDTMASAVPYNHSGLPLTPDADSIMDSPATIADGVHYDNESLDAHYIAGDGRVNENIGLSAMHHLFHSEHNTVATDIADILANHPDVTSDFRDEWMTGSEWDGERLYQAARIVNEMEYQHMAFDEFIGRISPSLPAFVAYDPTVKADVTAEFGSATYRLGHSMLNETIARSNPGTYYDAASNQDVSLLTGFTNPAQARLVSPVTVSSATKTGSNVVYTVPTGVTPPTVGEIVTIAGLDNPELNLVNALVDSRTAHSFTVSSKYEGGASGEATTLPGGNTSAASIEAPDGALVATVSVNDPGSRDGSKAFDYTPGESTAALAQGMSAQRANEIDEFVTDSVRNNLLGLPLDLASLNISRGRDVGIPTLNQFRTEHAASLTPYSSWNDFFNNLRNPASAVNFLAAYGTHPSITDPMSVASVTSASAVSNGDNKIAITYNSPDTAQIAVGNVITVTGLVDYNVTNAVVHSKDATSFTVRSAWPHSPTDPISFDDGASLRNDAPTAILGLAGSSIPTATSATVTTEPSIDERRIRAQAILDSNASDAINFLDSFGDWAEEETGLNYVDLWLGGLAESPAMQPVTPPLLGTTFQYVFEDQSLKLQNGDRFYYIGRLAGTNLGEEIPAQKLTNIVRRNTPSANAETSAESASGILGMNSPGFSIADCAWSDTPSYIPASAECPDDLITTTDGTLIYRGFSNTTGFSNRFSTLVSKLTGGGGDDALFGGAGNDVLNGGIGGDLIDGAEGNDRIMGLGGEDIQRGGEGDDVINTGESQLGDIANGNSGDDWLHCGNCTGALSEVFGQTGDDYLQGGKNADLLLQGGEGDDWIEGLAGFDWLQGDNGLLGGASPALYGGNDVIIGGAEVDTVFADAGDDIVFAGDGADAITSSYGFDWVSYQENKRLDNGGSKPGVYLDLSGVNPNPLNNNGDALLDTEAVSGSPGPDILVGGLGSDVTIPSVTGVAGSTYLVLPGAWPQMVSGMVVSGPGIGANATVIGHGDVAVVNGVTTTTVDLTVENTSTVTGPVDFTTYPLDDPALINGLSELVSGTPGWIKYTALDPAATQWTGGTVLLGGAGNDQLIPMGGENVLDGSASLRTCLTVTKDGDRYTTRSDTACDGGRGYTKMSLLSAAMDAGRISPSDVTVVREIVRSSAQVSSVTTTGTTATYTAANHTLTVGDFVSVIGASDSTFNIENVLVSAVSPTTFTVESTETPGTTELTAGRAKATDTLALPGASADYTVAPLTSLPSGVSVGYTITGPQSFVDTVYDVERIIYQQVPEENVVYTITYVYNSATGGETFRNDTYLVGGTSIVLPTPTRTNYTFAGWYLDEALNNKIGDAGELYVPTGEILELNLYAKWTEITVDPAAEAAAADLAARTIKAKKQFVAKALAKKVGVTMVSTKAKVTFTIARSSKKVCIKSGFKLKTLKAGKCKVTFTVQEPTSKTGKKPKAKKLIKTLVVK
ncbi:MAG: hypothetical protein F2839_04150 [Actinobacteria bacterium]|uniref:Unannotated protein n=1 Tax=freshwater metagenome TaxID=449393 RepID=A0A6J5ZCF9_9ZZZZ|nr:hypothetical protein [Actinomycetota bacterium]